MSSLTTERANLEAKHEKALEAIKEIKHNKINTIKAEDTAKLALQYLDTAYQQEDVALFYIYKLVEVIDKKLGGEASAKNTLGTSTEHNFIGKVTNASYGDVRHAPNPGEIIQKWTDDDIKKCFEYAEIIIKKYLEKLF